MTTSTDQIQIVENKVETKTKCKVIKIEIEEVEIEKELLNHFLASSYN
jgi:hypothetical protein